MPFLWHQRIILTLLCFGMLAMLMLSVRTMMTGRIHTYSNVVDSTRVHSKVSHQEREVHFHYHQSDDVDYEFDEPKAEFIFSNTLKNQRVDASFLESIFNEAFETLSKYNDPSLYNIMIDTSIRTGSHRYIPDTRVAACKHKQSHPAEKLPKASIVIPFHKEHWSVLLRTLHGIYQTVDMDFVEDIILVDDFNTAEVLRKPLQSFLRRLPKVKLLRTFRQEGLIRARLVGAKAAWGDVLVILDGHLMFNIGWLPPLLWEVAKNKSTVAIPALDSIDPIKFEYKKLPVIVQGVFDWELNFVWTQVSDIDKDRFTGGTPIHTPTMSGCVMAIDRDYFFSLGAYDDGLNIWGGESLELSFRVWMCSGQIVLVPCSKVGHLFRTNLPYMFSDDILDKNLQRIAEVWMDEYKTAYFLTKGRSYNFPLSEKISVRRRKRLRDKLECKSFNWYLNTVTNIGSPPNPDDVFSGNFKNVEQGTCIYANNETGIVRLEECSSYHQVQQVFHLRPNGCLRHSSGLCLSFTANSSRAILAACNASSSLQHWSFSPVVPESVADRLEPIEKPKPVGQYRWAYQQFTVCLKSARGSHQQVLTLAPCDFLDPSQYWIASHRIHKNVVIHDNIPDWFLF